MSPRNREKNLEQREESRTRIMDCALELFARHGYEKTSVQSIAREAGIAQGLLYHYFAGKDDLLRAIFARSVQDVQQAFSLASGTADPREQLEQLLYHSFTILKQNRNFWKLGYSLRMQPAVLAGLAEDFREATLGFQRVMEALFMAAGAPNPAIQAAILFALIDGIAQQYVLAPELYPLDAVLEEVIKTFLRAETG